MQSSPAGCDDWTIIRWTTPLEPPLDRKESPELNGARSLVDTLLKSGVDTCFANPGTSEMHFVAALDQSAGMRCVLGLHETVVTGMADGYFRIARKPACTLLHCGPGLANGVTNLHLARRVVARMIVECHIRTFAGEDFTQCATDATRSSSDDRFLSFEQSHKVS
jgi:hypothetical protein